MEDPGGKCLPMCAQEHWDTSTQRSPSSTFPTDTQSDTYILLFDTFGEEETDMDETDGELQYKGGSITGTCAAVDTLFLTPLLDVETLAGGRA